MSKKIVMYGTVQCPDTVKAQEILDKEGVKYAYLDILSSMANLRRFLNIRDANNEIFADCIKNRGIGVPIIVVDNKDIYIDMDSFDVSVLKD